MTVPQTQSLEKKENQHESSRPIFQLFGVYCKPYIQDHNSILGPYYSHIQGPESMAAVGTPTLSRAETALPRGRAVGTAGRRVSGVRLLVGWAWSPNRKMPYHHPIQWCLFSCINTYIYIYVLYIYISIYLSIYLSICLSVYQVL